MRPYVDDGVFSVYRGHWRHGDMLHPGWDSHRLRHHSYRLILQTEGKTNRKKTHATMMKMQNCS